jgi:hypothetical protein
MGMFAYLTINGSLLDIYKAFTAFKQTYVRKKKGFPKLKIRYECDEGYGYVTLLAVITQKGVDGYKTQTLEGFYDRKHGDIRGSGTIDLNQLTNSDTLKIRVVISITTTNCPTYEGIPDKKITYCYSYGNFPDRYEDSDDETERYFAHMFVDEEIIDVKRAKRIFKKTYIRNEEEGKFPTLNVGFECKGYDKPKVTVTCYRNADFYDRCYIDIDRHKESRFEHYRGQKYINLNNYAGDATKMHVAIGFCGNFYGVEYKCVFPYFEKPDLCENNE